MSGINDSIDGSSSRVPIPHVPTKSTGEDVDTQSVQSNAEILASIQNKQKHDLFTNDSLSFSVMSNGELPPISLHSGMIFRHQGLYYLLIQ